MALPSSQESLLPRRRSSSFSSSNDEKAAQVHQEANRNKFLVFVVSCLCLSLFANIALALGWRASQSRSSSAGDAAKHQHPTLLPALAYPARDAVKYQQVVFTSSILDGKTGYQGHPTPEKDKLWESLYHPLMSRISYDQARIMPNRTFPEKESATSGYPIVLNVFHDLHCLHSVRNAFYYFMADKWNATYNPYLIYESPAKALLDYSFHDMNFDHLDHCIDALRQSIMCTSDIAPNVWQYSDKAKAVRARATTVHECRDFNQVKEWAIQHSADGFVGFGTGPEVGLCSFDDPGSCKTELAISK